MGAALWLAALAQPAEARRPTRDVHPALAAELSPRAACLAAARRAERVHDLPDGLMVAIALSESGLHANALSIRGRAHFPESRAEASRLLRGASAGASVMAGCVQVNARVHARGSDWPLDPERATDWSGAVLRRGYADTGDWTTALRRWHGGSVRSSQAVVCRVRAKLSVAAAGAAVLDGSGCGEAQAARVRRSAGTLLEIAEAGLR